MASIPIPAQSSAGDRLLALARGALGALSVCEEVLIRSATAEDGASLGGREDMPWTSAEDNADKGPQVWGAEREIHAGVLRWLCVDKAACALVDPKGVRLAGARITGALDLSHAEIPFPLELSRCRIPDGVNLIGSKIPRVVLDGSWIGSVNADGADVKQSLFLGKGFRCDGEVSLVMAQVGATLVCEGGWLAHGKSKVALSADGLSVGGDALLRAASKHRPFRADGKVSLIGAKIGGDLDCSGGSFAVSAGEAINLERASIGGALAFTSDGDGDDPIRFQCEGVIDLQFASAKVLANPQACWPAKGNLKLNGFTYSDFDDPADAKTKLAWLSLDTTLQIPTQPYSQLAKVLLASGDSDGAKAVLQRKEKELTKNRILRALKWCIGYGYKPGRAVWGLIALTALGAFLVYSNSAHMSYVGDSAARTPHFQPLVYSFENTFPLVKLGQTDKWQPNPDADGLAHYLRWFVWIQTVLGWVFAGLFAAAVSGLVQHSD